MTKVAASILAADTMRMGDDARRILGSGCDSIHFDMMDGVFVPNISFGPNFLRDMKKEIDAYYDVHLMLQNPFPYIDVIARSGANAVTVHIECDTYAQSMQRIKDHGLIAGASLRPNTPVSALFDADIVPDQVLVMTVEPGFGGQKILPETILKIAEIRRLGYRGLIEADGGITKDNAKQLADAGADILVLGTALFKSENPKELVAYIHSL